MGKKEWANELFPLPCWGAAVFSGCHNSSLCYWSKMFRVTTGKSTGNNPACASSLWWDCLSIIPIFQNSLFPAELGKAGTRAMVPKDPCLGQLCHWQGHCTRRLGPVQSSCAIQYTWSHCLHSRPESWQNMSPPSALKFPFALWWD